jgi:hypothetical protein
MKPGLAGYIIYMKSLSAAVYPMITLKEKKEASINVRFITVNDALVI